MLHSELLVDACHSLSGGLLFGFPVLAILVTVLYLFKTQDNLRRERLIIKGLRELVANKDTDRHLPSTEVIGLAEKRFAELKAQSSIDPKLLLALDYNLNEYKQLGGDRRLFLTHILLFIFLTVFIVALSVIALFISPWLGPGQRVTVMILEFIPGIAGFAFLTYIVIKMLGWPEQDAVKEEEKGSGTGD